MNAIFMLALLAADFWQSKKPSEWTEKEVRKLLESSPWVKEAQPSMNMEAMGGGRGGMGGGGGMPPGGGMGGMGGGGGMPPGGMGGGGGPMGGMGGGGGMQMPRVKVVFETAIPVAEAKERIEIKDVFKGVRADYVVISLSGMRMMGQQRQKEGGEDRSKQMQERLLQLTTLKVKDDKVYQPAEIKTQQTANGPVMLFAFPRKEMQLSPDDKQITFKTKMGPMEISVKFNLKDMMFDNQLSL